MGRKTANIISRAHQEKFQEWFRFLEFARDKPKNNELLNEYFSQEFLDAPEDFYYFLLFLKKGLKSSKNRKEQIHIASKYLEIILPFCERFGFSEERDLLNDICFQIIKPEEYKEMKSKLQNYQKKSRKIINTILKVLTDLLQSNKYRFEIKGRYKNIYRIFQKVQKKNRDALALKDIFAFRIVLLEGGESKCFEVLNLLHDHFYPIAERFKDYISIPKINGYKSLHTGLTKVINELDIPIEVQIRTQEMDEFAEKGIAAHWLYTKKPTNLFKKALVSLFMKRNTSSEKSDHVWCFSYEGDVFQMQKGANILDFAYQIHTDLGNKTEGAMVNNKKVELTYQVETGDIIQILSAIEPQACSQWLLYSKNKVTLKKISSYLHSQSL